MKGIVLAGGSGTRLKPITDSINKQLLNIYDKPMVYYPIATLMLAGIRDIAIITTRGSLPLFESLLGDGRQLGVRFSYFIQASPNGIAEAFLICESFIAAENTALILGDNVFYGTGVGGSLAQHSNLSGALIFGTRVADPSSYGVVQIDSNGKPIRIEEKPTEYVSNIAIPGLYLFDEQVVDLAKMVTPSSRGELEITSLLELYLSRNLLSLEMFPRGTAWLDTGTFQGINDASSFVRIVEERQGLKIACLEEIAYRSGWISKNELEILASNYKNNFQEYLINLSNEVTF
jgi:glucose-1-phosphate thymidylyltransferase